MARAASHCSRCQGSSAIRTVTRTFRSGFEARFDVREPRLKRLGQILATGRTVPHRPVRHGRLRRRVIPQRVRQRPRGRHAVSEARAAPLRGGRGLPVPKGRGRSTNSARISCPAFWCLNPERFVAVLNFLADEGGRELVRARNCASGSSVTSVPPSGYLSSPTRSCRRSE